jgi:tetratricopeptide (TPR) repeat protein
MLDSFRSFFWSGRRVPRLQAWSIDRNWDRTEGERLLRTRHYAPAEKHLTRAAEDAEIRGYSTAKRIHVRLLLAEAQRKQFESDYVNPDHAKLDAAERTVRSAIDLAARTGDRPAYLLCLDALGDIFGDQGNFAAMEKVTQDAIQLETALPHPEPLRMARRVHRLGIAHHQAGRFEDAIPALEKAVSLHEQNYGADHRETGHQLTALGAVLRAHGDHQEAQQCLKRALKIHERTCGAQSPEAIQDLHHLAGSLEESGDLEAAAAQYERALAFQLRLIGGDLDQLAEMQFGLANLYLKWQNYSRARELLMEAVGAFKRKGGVRMAVGHETLAYVEECSGRFPDAIKELERAGKAWDALRPERLPELIRNMEHRADLFDMLRKKGEAAWMREKISHLAPPPALEASQAVPAA